MEQAKGQMGFDGTEGILSLLSHNSDGVLGSGGWGSWGRWAVLEERGRMVGKDVVKANFLLEFVSCGGNFNPEQPLRLGAGVGGRG